MSKPSKPTEEIVQEFTNPFRLLQEMRHRFGLTTQDIISLRRVLWLRVNGFVGQSSAPSSTREFNQKFRDYMDMPSPAPLLPLMNNVVQERDMTNLTEISFDQEHVVNVTTSTQGGWSQAIFTKMVNFGEPRRSDIEGDKQTARNFVSAVRRLVCILKVLNVKRSRFIRVEVANHFFVPPQNASQVRRRDWPLFKKHSHKVSCSELWTEILGRGDAPLVLPSLKINLWRAEIRGAGRPGGGGMLYFFNSEE